MAPLVQMSRSNGQIAAASLRTRVVPSASATEPSTSSPERTVTIEYQRQRAKELTKYFNEQKREREINNSKVLGWTLKNEIGNGRWVMMGLAIGMLTEQATGVNFPDQIKLTLSYLGVVDLSD